MKYVSVVQCRVRPEHIDGNRHLGAHFYGIYFQKGQTDLLETAGLGIEELARREQPLRFVIARDGRKYDGEIFVNDGVLEVYSQFESCGRAHARIVQEIRCGGETKTTAWADFVFVKGEWQDKRRIIRPPRDLLERIEVRI